MVVTQLTGTGHTPGHTGGMPRTNTTDLAVTSMGLLLQMSHTETLDGSSISLTLGDTNNVNVLVLSEDLIDSDFLLEESITEVNLLSDVLATVDLDFEDVVLLLSEVLQELELGVSDDAHNGAVLLNTVELGLELLGGLQDALVVLVEGFLLGVNPVLVETTDGVALEVAGPNGGKGTQSTGSLDVANETNNADWWRLNDGDGLNDLLLVQLGSNTVDLTENVGHASLESREGGEMAWLLGVVLGEGSNATAMVAGPPARNKSEISLTGTAVLSVAHLITD